MKKKTGKLRKWIINKLGGVTEEQLHNMIKHHEAKEWYLMKDKAKSLYGKNPEEWCESMWVYIMQKIREHEKAMY